MPWSRPSAVRPGNVRIVIVAPSKSWDFATRQLSFAAGPEVVVWTLPPGTPLTAGTGWTAMTPQGTGLASTTTENAITALTTDGATLTGVGFTARLTKLGTPGTSAPTLWQSPVRY